MTWYWCSICDLDKPEGERLVGVAIMRDPYTRPTWAAEVEHIARAETLIHAVPADFGDPPDEWADKLLTDKRRIEALTQEWHKGPAMTLGEYEDEHREQCSQCGAEILGCHACQGVPGGFSDDD